MAHPRPLLPPFTEETARLKIQFLEGVWNTRKPEKVALAYAEDSEWRSRDAFIVGREHVVEFLAAKWQEEFDYRLRKELWAFTGNRIAARFEYEYHNASGQWFRAYGNESFEFDESGLVRRCDTSINDIPIGRVECRIPS